MCLLPETLENFTITQKRANTIENKIKTKTIPNWPKMLSKMCNIFNHVTTKNLLNMSPAQVHFKRTFDISRFIGGHKKEDFRPQEAIYFDHSEFRKSRLGMKAEKRPCDRFEVGDLVEIKDQQIGWLKDHYEVIGIREANIIVEYQEGDSVEQYTKHYDEVRLLSQK